MARCLGLIFIASLTFAACGGSPLDRPAPATPLLFSPANVTPPSTLHAAAPAASSAPTPTVTLSSLPAATAVSGAAQIIVHGKIYDATRGFDQRLTNAVIEWQFTALDWQAHNGRLPVPDGIYQLPLVVRPDDELIITAHAPGYLPSTTQVQAAQLGEFGTRLNFGLIRTDGPVPTVPGSLGAVKLSGIVYNSERGLAAPIGQADITIVKNSVVEPSVQIDVLTDTTGTFSATLDLHATDLVGFTITASGYVTATLARNAKDLANNPRLLIGLRAAQ